jgi:hypothetical protein
MGSTAELPTLRIIPIKHLLRHEWHDDQRSQPLIDSLGASGVLRNPPMVTPLEDGSGRYMVLDGANRTTALDHMGIRDCLAQVVDPDDPKLVLKKWNHVLWNWDPQALVQAISSIGHLDFHEIDPEIKRKQSEWPRKTLVWLQTPDGRAYIARSEPGALASHARKLAEIAETYLRNAELDRTTAQRVSEVNGVYDNLCAVVVYPPFTVHEVLELCAKGVLLPPGVTRFMVTPRALRVNYPLDALSEDKPLEAKNAALDAWINERVARKGVRYYDEPTVLYDE